MQNPSLRKKVWKKLIVDTHCWQAFETFSGGVGDMFEPYLVGLGNILGRFGRSFLARLLGHVWDILGRCLGL